MQLFLSSWFLLVQSEYCAAGCGTLLRLHRLPARQDLQVLYNVQSPYQWMAEKKGILRNSPEFLKKYFQKWTKKKLFAKIIYKLVR